jgi:hypothetical protein
LQCIHFLCGGTEKGFATSSWSMQVGIEASDSVPWSLVQDQLP